MQTIKEGVGKGERLRGLNISQHSSPACASHHSSVQLPTFHTNLHYASWPCQLLQAASVAINSRGMEGSTST